MELKELQLSELKILSEFKRICEENNLTYFLQAGTLLGAVRHGGFIPWDDDIDVSMPRSDYDRLALLCREKLGRGFFFQDSSTDPCFPYCFSKIRRMGTEVYEEHLKNVRIHKGHYIDIFPLDVCPRNEFLARLYFKSVTMVISAYMAKVNPDFVCGYRKKTARLMWRLLKRLSVEKLGRLRDRIAILPSAFGSSGRLCTVGGIHGYPAETYESEWFSNTVRMTFENMSFSAPSGWNEILTHMYGDYMTPVDTEHREGHFVKMKEEDRE